MNNLSGEGREGWKRKKTRKNIISEPTRTRERDRQGGPKLEEWELSSHFYHIIHPSDRLLRTLLRSIFHVPFCFSALMTIEIHKSQLRRRQGETKRISSAKNFVRALLRVVWKWEWRMGKKSGEFLFLCCLCSIQMAKEMVYIKRKKNESSQNRAILEMCWKDNGLVLHSKREREREWQGSVEQRHHSGAPSGGSRPASTVFSWSHDSSPLIQTFSAWERISSERKSLLIVRKEHAKK